MNNLFKRFKLSLVLVSVLSFATMAIAEDVPTRGPVLFSTYDMNKDGFVSETEFYDIRAARISKNINQGRAMRKAGMAPDFESFDSDGDGKLTKVELLEGQNKQMRKNRANRGYNKASRQQAYMGVYRPSFNDFDLNGNGYLTKEEMDEVRAKRADEKSSQGKMLRNSSNATPFSDIDSNNDGKVSKEEFISNRVRKHR